MHARTRTVEQKNIASITDLFNNGVEESAAEHIKVNVARSNVKAVS